VDWSQVRRDFEHDGALRDIYVLRTDLADWDRVLDHLRQSHQPLAYRRDDKPTPLPAQASEILADREVAKLLSFRVGEVQLNCHFFAEEEIDFDLDPTEVRDSTQVDALTRFMSQLGQVTRKVVLLTPESAPEIPILRLDPADGEVTYVSPLS